MKKTEITAEGLRTAVWSAFPTVDIFRAFKGDKRNISSVERFIDLAQKEKLIKKKNENDFEELLSMSKELYKSRKPAMEFSYDALLTEIKKEKSIKSLVGELREMAEVFALEKPDEVLFTRMKQDFHSHSIKRQHALMLLAIWLGLNKSELGINYQILVSFPRSASEPAVEETMGVLVTFAFMGENIDATTIDFLKKELPECIRDLKLSYLSEKRITYLATTCMARFPIKEGMAGYPATYGQAMRDALSLAYQMVITWQLSSMYTSRISFIIAIDAGVFSTIEIAAKDLLAGDLPSEKQIRVSHFALTAAKKADLKVVFDAVKYPNVWSAEHFWAFPYFKSPPVLMPSPGGEDRKPGLLPETEEEVKRFRNALFLGEKNDYRVLSTVHQFPPKILASLEIAHVATMRRLHHEAVQLLNDVLSFDPLNYIARTLRFHNFMALSAYTQSPDAARLDFERALYDGQFIENYCPPDPEFYAEYSLIYWVRAIKLIKLMRKGLIAKEKHEEMTATVLSCIETGEHLAKKGLAVSTSGLDNRCGFWLVYYMAFRKLIDYNREALTDINQHFEDTTNLYPEVFQTCAEVMGWSVALDESGTIDEGYLETRALLSMETFLNSLSSTSQYPHAAIGACTFMWDFSGPERKRKVIDHILMLLDVIRMKIEELKPLCLGTFSATTTLIEIQSPQEYIICVERIKKAVVEVKETGNYATGMKLLLHNLDFDTKSRPITFDLIRRENV